MVAQRGAVTPAAVLTPQRITLDIRFYNRSQACQLAFLLRSLSALPGCLLPPTVSVCGCFVTTHPVPGMLEIPTTSDCPIPSSPLSTLQLSSRGLNEQLLHYHHRISSCSNLSFRLQRPRYALPHSLPSWRISLGALDQLCRLGLMNFSSAFVDQHLNGAS